MQLQIQWVESDVFLAVQPTQSDSVEGILFQLNPENANTPVTLVKTEDVDVNTLVQTIFKSTEASDPFTALVIGDGENLYCTPMQAAATIRDLAKRLITSTT